MAKVQYLYKYVCRSARARVLCKFHFFVEENTFFTHSRWIRLRIKMISFALSALPGRPIVKQKNSANILVIDVAMVQMKPAKQKNESEKNEPKMPLKSVECRRHSCRNRNTSPHNEENFNCARPALRNVYPISQHHRNTAPLAPPKPPAPPQPLDDALLSIYIIPHDSRRLGENLRDLLTFLLTFNSIARLCVVSQK